MGTTPTSAPLVLASTSPRRQALLREAGFEFTWHSPKADEHSCAESPRALVLKNAHLKAVVALPHYADRVILAADTIVVFEDRIFGKPRDLVEAASMLMILSGQRHQVLTGVVIRHGGILREFVETSHVFTRLLSPPKIATYLDRIGPLDKAGAYAAQDDLGEFVHHIEGSTTNVIGLPMEFVTRVLREDFALRPTQPAAGSRHRSR